MVGILIVRVEASEAARVDEGWSVHGSMGGGVSSPIQSFLFQYGCDYSRAAELHIAEK